MTTAAGHHHSIMNVGCQHCQAPIYWCGERADYFHLYASTPNCFLITQREDEQLFGDREVVMKALQDFDDQEAMAAYVRLLAKIDTGRPG